MNHDLHKRQYLGLQKKLAMTFRRRFFSLTPRFALRLAPRLALRIGLGTWLGLTSCYFAEVAKAQDGLSAWPRFLGTNIDGAVDWPVKPSVDLSKTDASNSEGLPSETDLQPALVTDWSADLKLRWQIAAGEGYAIGVVANGNYYHFDKEGDAARLRCVDVKTGEQIWEYAYRSTYRDLYGYDSGPRSSPLVDGDRVYLFGVEGNLVCVDANDGRAIWTVDTAKKFGVIQNFFGVSSNPVIYENKLLVMVGGSPPEDQAIPRGQLDRVSSNGSFIVAFDKFTGEVKYRTGNDLASYSSLTWMGQGKERTLIAWGRGEVWGIEPDSGEVEFTFPWRAKKLESVNAMTPLVDVRRFFISECYEIGSAFVEVDEDGKPQILWSDKGKRDKSMAVHWGTPVLHKGFLYGCSGRHSGSADLRCVELETGDVRWVKRGFKRCSVLRIGEHLVVLGESGRLILIEANPDAFTLISERKPIDKFRLIPNCWAAPIFADGCLFVRDRNKVGCFQMVK